MITAHILVNHPNADLKKFSVQHHERSVVEIGIARVVYDYASRNHIPMDEVELTVKWLN